jgi:DNA-directed RNA polymerase subunit M/transcription elongation factor TFIIS
MKEIYCDTCGRQVITLEAKSTIHTGFKLKCKKCLSEKERVELPEGFNELFKGFK